MEEKEKREKKPKKNQTIFISGNLLLNAYLAFPPHFLYYFITVYKRGKLFYCCVGIIHVSFVKVCSSDIMSNQFCHNVQKCALLWS